MVDIQSATAEIRRGKEIERQKERNKPHGKNIMACPIPQGGHNNDQLSNHDKPHIRQCLPHPLIMAALRSRCGHYIFALWFLSFYLSFLFLA